MPLQPMDVRAVQRDAAARAVLRRWRELTGGSGTRDPDRRTLVACSGGADSTALVLALADSQPLVGHVVHDLRDRAETSAERDRVASLAAGLGLGFIETAVAVRALPGNAEANARRARYRALEALASRAGCPFVATAHHAGDQLETMLMAMLRGAGIGGLAGMPASRALGRRGVLLVRPMLGIGRADAERLCTLAGVGWATDPTNADISRFRAALRHGPLRALEAMRPGGARGPRNWPNTCARWATCCGPSPRRWCATRQRTGAACGGIAPDWPRSSASSRGGRPSGLRRHARRAVRG